MSETENSLLDEYQKEAATDFEDISIDVMDGALREYQIAKAEDAKRKVAKTEAFNEMELKKKALMDLLTRSGKDNWEVKGIGKASLTHKLQVPTLKTIEQKQEFAKYLESVHGKETFWGLFNVHSASLNSFNKKELENNPDAVIPGLEAPVAVDNISFRSKK